MLINEPTRILLKIVSDDPKNVSVRLASALGISRQSASARLRAATSNGLIAKHGVVGRGVVYVLSELDRVYHEYDRAGLSEDRVWTSLFAPMVKDLPENVRDVWRYGFTEMVNNANKFAPRALHLSPRQDRGVLRCRKPKTARYADFKNTNYNVPRGKTTGNCKLIRRTIP